MPQEIAVTSLKALFRFPFQGSDWRNRFLVGAALMFASFVIPIVPLPFVYGYVVRVMQQAIQGQELSLPAWDDWGRLAVDGLRVMLVGLVYFLPGMLVSFGGMAVYFGSSFALPVMMAGASESSELLLGVPLLILASMAIMFVSMFIGSLLFFLGAVPLPVATAHFVAQDKVAVAFRVREWWPLLSRNKLGWFIAWVIMMGLVGVLYLVTMMAYYTVVLCFLIPLLAAPIGFYLALMGAALFGGTYRESVAIQSAVE